MLIYTGIIYTVRFVRLLDLYTTALVGESNFTLPYMEEIQSII